MPEEELLGLFFWLDSFRVFCLLISRNAQNVNYLQHDFSENMAALFTSRGKTFDQWMTQVSKVALIIEKQSQLH